LANSSRVVGASVPRIASASVSDAIWHQLQQHSSLTTGQLRSASHPRSADRSGSTHIHQGKILFPTLYEERWEKCDIGLSSAAGIVIRSNRLIRTCPRSMSDSTYYQSQLPTMPNPATANWAFCSRQYTFHQSCAGYRQAYRHSTAQNQSGDEYHPSLLCACWTNSSHGGMRPSCVWNQNAFQCCRCSTILPSEIRIVFVPS
jgi:hypothetical protein